MPALLPVIGIILGTIVASLVARILFALGMGFVTYKGFRLVLDAIEDIVISHFGGLPADVIVLLSKMNIDNAVTVILSSYAARLAINVAMGANRRLSILPSLGGD